MQSGVPWVFHRFFDCSWAKLRKTHLVILEVFPSWAKFKKTHLVILKHIFWPSRCSRKHPLLQFKAGLLFAGLWLLSSWARKERSRCTEMHAAVHKVQVQDTKSKNFLHSFMRASFQTLMTFHYIDWLTGFLTIPYLQQITRVLVTLRIESLQHQENSRFSIV